ncbi:MAG TPA: hypothetical protein VG265_11970 [Gaiellaceae bacterium]|nr:hypothetical protein [Gaiellaceae bacterium]
MFFDRFSAVNKDRELADQLSVEQLWDRARIRARAVRFKDEWCCPRHTKLTSPTHQEGFLDAVYSKSCRPKTKRKGPSA